MTPHYDPVSKILHWLIFVLLAIEFVVAWTMPGGRGMTEPTALVNFHFSLGLLILLVMLARTAWRLTHKSPEVVGGRKNTMDHLAHLLHVTFYAVLIILPFLGWAWANSRGWTVRPFGLFDLPSLVAKGSTLGRTLGNLHSLLAATLVGLIGIHVAAAFYHHIILKDDILMRMVPKRKK